MVSRYFPDVSHIFPRCSLNVPQMFTRCFPDVSHIYPRCSPDVPHRPSPAAGATSGWWSVSWDEAPGSPAVWSTRRAGWSTDPWSVREATCCLQVKGHRSKVTALTLIQHTPEPGSTWLLRGAADGEGVPLVFGDLWDVDVDVISRFELEELRAADHQVSHLRITQTQSHVLIYYKMIEETLLSGVLDTLDGSRLTSTM